MLLNACTDIEILNVLSIVKTIITIATIVVPVILTIMIMVDIIKTVSSNDVDTKKLFNTIIKRAVAAVLIFLIPFLIQLAISMVPSGNYKYIDCYNKAEKDTIAKIAFENANNSLGNLNSVLNKDGFDKSNKGDYNAAYLAYEQARKDIKKIPNGVEVEEGTYCKTKEQCVKKLEELEKKFK